MGDQLEIVAMPNLNVTVLLQDTDIEPEMAKLSVDLKVVEGG